MAQTIQHIVFDIGGVLLHYDPERPYRRLIEDEEKRRWFLQEVCSPDWNREQDRGRPWPEAEAALIERYPQEADLIRAFREHWPEMIPNEVEGSPAIVKALVDGGHDVTMLTNFAADTFKIAKERFEVLQLARGVTVSGEEKVIKPDPEIYRRHQERFELDGPNTIFFDDSPQNVEAAFSLGWEAHVFTSPAAMASTLEAAGFTL